MKTWMLEGSREGGAHGRRSHFFARPRRYKPHRLQTSTKVRATQASANHSSRTSLDSSTSTTVGNTRQFLGLSNDTNHKRLSLPLFCQVGSRTNAQYSVTVPYSQLSTQLSTRSVTVTIDSLLVYFTRLRLVDLSSAHQPIRDELSYHPTRHYHIPSPHTGS